jgi:hypothetical protein
VNVWGVGYRLVDAPLRRVPERDAALRRAGLDVAI